MSFCANYTIPEHVCCCNITSTGQPSSGEDKAYIGHVNFMSHKPSHANCAMSGTEIYSYVLKCKNTINSRIRRYAVDQTTVESGESGAVLPITVLLCLVFLTFALFAFWKIQKSYIPRIKQLEAERNNLLKKMNSRMFDQP